MRHDIRTGNNRGVSLVELVVTLVILSILAAVILPSAQMTARRTKELELKRNLRIIRTALDEYKKKYDEAVSGPKPTMQKSADKSGYPESLQQLVEGYDFGEVSKNKVKFLRRIPRDPFNTTKPGEGVKEEELWGLRSYVDEPDSTSWGGKDVYDVYSLSAETAIDGTKYKDW